MKKTLSTITSVMLAFTVSAQISITSSDMPVSGSKSYITTALPTSMDLMLGETGTNHTWDYTNLTTITEDVVTFDKATDIHALYIFFGLSAYGKLVFDEMSFGAYTIEDIYDFYKTSSTKFEAVGRGISFNGSPIPSFFTDKDIIYDLPLTFGDNNTDDFSVTFMLPGLIELTQSGTRTTTVDGWGKVTTPYKTYDCIRVVSEIDMTNSVKIGALPALNFPTKIVEYKWLAKGEVIPVLTISGNEVLSNFVPNNVSYRSEDPKISVNRLDKTQVSVYPNPFNDKINISSDAQIVEVTLTDVTGKVVAVTNESELDASQLDKGIYFAQVTTAQGVFIKKVVKQ